MSLVPSNPVRNVPQGGLPLVGGLLGGLQGTPALRDIPTHRNIRTVRHIRTSLPSASLLDLLQGGSILGGILIGCRGQERYEALLEFNPNRLFFIYYTRRA